VKRGFTYARGHESQVATPILGTNGGTQPETDRMRELPRRDG